MTDSFPVDASARRRWLLGAGGAAVAVAGAALVAPAAGRSVSTAPGRPGRVSQPAAETVAVGKSGSEQTLTPPLAVRALHRMGYGPARRARLEGSGRPGQIFASGFESSRAGGIDDVAHFMALGSSDDARLAAYVEEQLDPNLDDSELQRRLAEHPEAFATLGESLSTAFNTRECQDFNTYVRPLREVEKATLTRAVFSRRQLFELTVDFWHNHFNVFAFLSEDTLASWASWDRDVIRRHAFGNFYSMLEASAKHAVMLRYLDNYRNSEGGFNENYARELLELHTLGAENYRGLQPQLTVEALEENPYTVLDDAELNDPSLCGGQAIADPARAIARYYVDDDVYAAAQALSGWRYVDQTTASGCGSGAFFVSESDHYITTKAILSGGRTIISSDQGGELDGRLTLKLCAYHPGTARYIARKLCRRLISDDPPDAVVDAAAETFFRHRRSSTQISRTLRTILLSDAFKDASNWGNKTKRPFEYVASALRATACRHTFREGDSTSGDFFNVFNSAGQRLFNWRTPDGYPDRRQHWQGSTSLVHGWRSIDWLVDRNASDPATRVLPVIDLTLQYLPGNPTPRQIVAFWCDWLLGFTPAGGWVGAVDTGLTSEPTTVGRAAMQFFTQQGFNGLNDRFQWPSDEPIAREELSQNRNGYDWNRRLLGLVALILWSPNFLQR